MRRSILAPESGEALALVHGDARLIVHDAQERGPARQYVERGGNKTYTCVCWSPGERLLGVGTAQGEIVVWDVIRGVRSAFGTKPPDWSASSGVDSITFCSWDKLLLVGSSSSESRVGIWEIDTSEKAKIWCLKADKRGVSAVSASSNGVLATASTRVRLIRSSSEQPPNETNLRRRTLDGMIHTEPITALAWSTDGRFLASCGTDRSVLIFDSSSNLPIFALSLSFAASALSLRHCNQRLELAAADTHTISLERIRYQSNAKENGSTQHQDKEINRGWLPADSSTLHAGNARIFDAALPHAKNGLAVCMDATERPVWRALSATEIDICFERKTLGLDKEEEEEEVVVNSKTKENKARKLPDILDSTPPITTKRARSEIEPLCELPELSTAPDDEAVLGERLALLEAAADERENERLDRLRNVGTDNKQPIGDASSLAVVLAQALKANDDRLIEEVLQHSESRLIERTVDRLAPALALPLLRAIARRIERRPNRGNQLTPWATQLLVTHASALARAPDLEAQLAPLDNLLAKRLDALPKMLALLGRFDFAFKRLRSDPALPSESSASGAEIVLDDSLAVGVIPGTKHSPASVGDDNDKDDEQDDGDMVDEQHLGDDDDDDDIEEDIEDDEDEDD